MVSISRIADHTTYTNLDWQTDLQTTLWRRTCARCALHSLQYTIYSICVVHNLQLLQTPVWTGIACKCKAMCNNNADTYAVCARVSHIFAKPCVRASNVVCAYVHVTMGVHVGLVCVCACQSRVREEMTRVEGTQCGPHTQLLNNT